MARKQRVKKKDPTAPKRSMSGFMFFSNAIREQVKEEMPHLKFTEISKEIGARWQQLPERKKKPFQKQALQDKARYEQEKAEYVPDPEWVRAQEKKRRKDPNAPKRAMSGFMFYSNAIREQVKEEMPHLKFTEISKEIGARWQQLSERKKKPFHRQALQDKERYEQEKATYVPDPEWVRAQGKKRKKDPNAPKKAMSAYLYFCNDKRPAISQANPELKMTDIAKLLAAEWRECTEGDKWQYQQAADEDKERYAREKAAYEAGESYGHY